MHVYCCLHLTLSDKRFYGFACNGGQYLFFNADVNKSSFDLAVKLSDGYGKPLVDVADDINTNISDIGKYIDRNATFGFIFAGLKALPQLDYMAQLAGGDQIYN